MMTQFSSYWKENRVKIILEAIILNKGFQKIISYLKNKRGTVMEWNIAKHAMLNYIEERK